MAVVMVRIPSDELGVETQVKCHEKKSHLSSHTMKHAKNFINFYWRLIGVFYFRESVNKLGVYRNRRLIHLII